MKLVNRLKRNTVKFDKVEWFKMYHISDDRVVGKAGNLAFCANGFDVQHAAIVGQQYIDSFEFKPLSSNFTSLVKLDYVKSEKVFETNAKTGIFEI